MIRKVSRRIQWMSRFRTEGVVLWNDLVENITKLGETPVTSALLAYQLIEGVESVEFTVGEA